MIKGHVADVTAVINGHPSTDLTMVIEQESKSHKSVPFRSAGNSSIGEEIFRGEQYWVNQTKAKPLSTSACFNVLLLGKGERKLRLNGYPGLPVCFLTGLSFTCVII